MAVPLVYIKSTGFDKHPGDDAEQLQSIAPAHFYRHQNLSTKGLASPTWSGTARKCTYRLNTWSTFQLVDRHLRALSSTEQPVVPSI